MGNDYHFQRPGTPAKARLIHSAAVGGRTNKALTLRQSKPENSASNWAWFSDIRPSVDERAAFNALTDFGGDLVDLPQKEMGSNPLGAIKNAREFAAEVLEIIQAVLPHYKMEVA